MVRSSRDRILQTLRATPLEEASLPALDGPWTVYADCRKQFAEVLASVGGQALVVRDLEELNARLEEMAAYRDAKQICSLVSGLRRDPVDLVAVADPHDLETIDFFIAPAEFAVAENGAVWVTDRAVQHRVLYFITQHLAIVVPADAIVSNLPQAYERLSFREPHFGMFLSGPSKTADIEQSLVIGAHGARSLTVFLLETHDHSH